MRVLEGILIVLHLVWLSTFLLRAGSTLKLASNMASLILLILHLVLEGYRWQMGLTYFLFILLTILTLVSFFHRNVQTKPSQNQKKRNFKKLLYSLLLLLYVLGSLGPVTLMPVFKLPKPTGPFEVGMNSRHLLGGAGADSSLSEQEVRELMIQIWYPADVKKDSKNIRYESFPYEEWAGTVEFLFSVPRFFFDYLKYGQTNSIQDIALSNQQKQYPILLFSHGFGSTRMQSFSQMEELASHGYVVVSVDHMIDGAYTKFPDGREVMNKADAYSYSFNIEDDKEVKARSKDMTFVLDQLTKLNDRDPQGLFTGKLDMERIGIFGHSYGGSTAAQALLDDARILAGINIDGPLHEPVASKGLERPFMFIINKDYLYLDENEIKYTNITVEQFQQYHRKMKELADFHYKEGIQGDTYKLTFNTGDHYSFTDFPYLSPILSWSVDVQQFHQVMNQYVTAFFNHYVKKEEVDPILVKEHQVDRFYSYETNRKDDPAGKGQQD